MKIKNVSILLMLLMMFLIVPASAAEDVVISSPSDGAILTEPENIPIYIQVSNASMTDPFIQISYPGNIGTWEPTNQIDSNLFLKYFDVSAYENNNYIISVKSTLSGVEYFDSITITVSKDDTEPETDNNTLYVDGLTDGGEYENKSMWVEVQDSETGEAIERPVLSIYNPDLKFTTTGSTSGLIKIEWEDLDGYPLAEDSYRMVFKADGYEPLEFIIDLECEDQDTTTEQKTLSVAGLDKKIAVFSPSDIWVMDSDTDKRIEGAAVKVKDKKTGTVIKSETTDSWGEAYIIWDVVGDFTVSITYSDYKPFSYSVEVVDPAATVQETPTTTEPEQPAEPEDGGVTRAEVEEYLATEQIDGQPYIDYLKGSAYDEGYNKGYNNGTAIANQEDIDKSTVEKVKDNAVIAGFGLVGCLGFLGMFKLSKGPVIKENVAGLLKRNEDPFFDEVSLHDLGQPVREAEPEAVEVQEFDEVETEPEEPEVTDDEEPEAEPEQPAEPEDEVNEDRPHPCPFCDWGGKTKPALKAHITRFHPSELYQED